MAKIVSDFCMGEETYTLTYECVSMRTVRSLVQHSIETMKVGKMSIKSQTHIVQIKHELV